MHELSIAFEIIAVLKGKLSADNLTRISEVKLKIGALAGVDPEALKFGFKSSTLGTELENTELDIEWLDITGRCRNCGINFSIDDLVFLCPECDSADIEIKSGEELEIEYLVADG